MSLAAHVGLTLAASATGLSIGAGSYGLAAYIAMAIFIYCADKIIDAIKEKK